MHIVGFFVLDSLLGVRRAPYAVVITDQIECSVPAIRALFQVPSDIGLYVVEGADRLGSPDLDVVLNVDRLLLLRDGRVVAEGGRVVDQVEEVVLVSQIDSCYKAAKVLRTNHLYPELEIGDDIVNAAMSFIDNASYGSTESAAECAAALQYWDVDFIVDPLIMRGME